MSFSSRFNWKLFLVADDGSGDGKPSYDEHATIFFLELLVRITIQNR